MECCLINFIALRCLMQTKHSFRNRKSVKTGTKCINCRELSTQSHFVEKCSSTRCFVTLPKLFRNCRASYANILAIFFFVRSIFLSLSLIFYCSAISVHLICYTLFFMCNNFHICVAITVVDL